MKTVKKKTTKATKAPAKVTKAAKVTNAPVKGCGKKGHPFVGKYVLCRCYAAGVHTGVLKQVDKDTCILENSRRLWQWSTPKGVALSGVAQHGINGGKVDVVNPEIYLTQVCEIIPCSPLAEQLISGFAS